MAAKSIASGSVNISGRFHFRQWSSGPFFYKEGKGELGVPGRVMTHRDKKAQETVSAGTGEHAGHLIGIQFGAPGGIENLGLQNPNMNTWAPKRLQEALLGPGGSYYDLEKQWKQKLLQGWKIEVVVTDKYKRGENRPFTRSVRWTETSPAGISTTIDLDYGNFGSQQQREAQSA